MCWYRCWMFQLWSSTILFTNFMEVFCGEADAFYNGTFQASLNNPSYYHDAAAPNKHQPSPSPNGYGTQASSYTGAPYSGIGQDQGVYQPDHRPSGAFAFPNPTPPIPMPGVGWTASTDNQYPPYKTHQMPKPDPNDYRFPEPGFSADPGMYHMPDAYATPQQPYVNQNNFPAEQGWTNQSQYQMQYPGAAGLSGPVGASAYGNTAYGAATPTSYGAATPPIHGTNGASASPDLAKIPPFRHTNKIWIIPGVIATNPTVYSRSNQGFNPHYEAQQLYKKLSGHDHASIVIQLASYPHDERAQIVQQFPSVSRGQTIVEMIKRKMAGKMYIRERHLAVALGMEVPLFAAHQLKKSMNRSGTDEDALFRIMVSLSNGQIADVRDVYPRTEHKTLSRQNHTLVSAIKGDLQGLAETLLVTIANGERDENGGGYGHHIQYPNTPPVNPAQVQTDVASLMTGNAVSFATILGKRNYLHISEIVKLYPKINIAINNAKSKGWTDDLRKLCKYIIEAAVDFPKFIATQINKSMKGVRANFVEGGTDEDALTLFMLLSQSYMRTIIAEYPKMVDCIA